MRKLLLVTAVFVLGSPAYAATGTFSAQRDYGQSPYVASSDSRFVVAATCGVSPSSPCKPNNGYGNGGGDGTPGGSGGSPGGGKCGVPDKKC